MKALMISLAILLALTSFKVECKNGDAPVIQTSYGPIKGVSNDKANMYLGIPFAQPPVNDLRWKAPLPNKPWSPNVLDATGFKAACPQLNCASRIPAHICPVNMSEDCLYLNVFLPKANSTQPKAVMLYIHGGNFEFQGANSPLFNGQYFSNFSDVIIVTIQYRLGALGFLAIQDAQYKGNFGILDQRLAINWVKNNIFYFGGDASRITLFGQSAGAQSVLIHLLSVDMKNNFNNAIIQSPPISIPFRSDKEASNIFNIFSELLNCTNKDIECLKEKPLDKILNAQNQVHSKLTSIKLLENLQPWLPWIDSKLIKGQLLEIEKWIDLRNSSLNMFMIGSLTEECFIYIFMGLKQPINTFEYCGIFLAGFKQHSLKVIEQFPPAANEDNRNLLSQVATRWIFSCSVRNFLQNVMKMNVNRTEPKYYHYVFDYPLDFEGWDNFSFCDNHVCHSADLYYTFDTADTNFTSIGKSIARSHMTYWSNFAKYSNPSPLPLQSVITDNNPVWMAYDLNKKPFLRFTGSSIRVEYKYLQKECDFFDSIGYYY